MRIALYTIVFIFSQALGSVSLCPTFHRKKPLDRLWPGNRLRVSLPSMDTPFTVMSHLQTLPSHVIKDIVQ